MTKGSSAPTPTLFLDANVLFTAAHRPTGKAALVLELAKTGSFNVVTCEFAAEEARRNLARKYPECVPTLEGILTSLVFVPTVVAGSCPIELPTKDRAIFLSAHAAGCSHLLTGDHRHFGRYMCQPQTCGGVCIQTVADFLG